MTTATAPSATSKAGPTTRAGGSVVGSPRARATAPPIDRRVRSRDRTRAILSFLEDSVDENARLPQYAVLSMLEDLDLENAKIDRVNAELRAEVAEQKRTEQVLRVRTNQLASCNAQLEQFAYVASHDLSEPLRAIAGPISLLARRYEGRLGDDADEFIGFAVDGCQRMQAIIDSLLAYSCIGELEETIVPVDCNHVVGAALSGLASMVAETGADIAIGELPTVPADVTQLSLVFQNLISNALKFVAPGVRPRVAIDAARAAGQWHFSVTDNGIGIDRQHRDRIFGMFNRLHGREFYPGSGIGLALAKKIVERHGGTIGMDDGPRGGSRFWFTYNDNEATSQ
jgi:light-regulated signal transduction histidine kinase (bacteriophytochrome)